MASQSLLPPGAAADAADYLGKLGIAGAVQAAVAAVLAERPEHSGDALRLLADRLREEGYSQGAAAEQSLVGLPPADHQHSGGGQSPAACADPAAHAESLRPLQGRCRPDLVYSTGARGLAAGADFDAAQLRRIVRELVPHAEGSTDEELPVAHITGGLTNQLYRVGVPEQKGPAVLVRVFGGEGAIDRELENATYAALAAAGLAPPYYGRFGNGRIEGWLPARALELADMADPSVYRRVAQQMRRVHLFEVPPGLQQYYTESSMWQQMLRWLEEARGAVGQLKGGALGAQVAARASALEGDLLGPGLSRAAQEVRMLQQEIPRDSPVCFCHNDVLAGNALRDPQTGAVSLIDFEYGGANFRGFDIANHWNEWCGGTHVMTGIGEYGRFPTPEQQLDWCRAYLGEAGGDDAGAPALVSESLKYVLAVLWYYALWGITRAPLEGLAEFDYLTYARCRIARYFSVKEQFLSA